MYSPEKKKRKTTKKPSLTLQSIPNASLPNDLLLNIFARVSRLHYPSLSLASYHFRSQLTSRDLYRTRISLGNTESCLYVYLKFSPDTNPSWFTLSLKPNRIDTVKKKKKNSGVYVLAKLPIRNSPPAHCSGLVALGSNIYNIGGCTDDSPSSSVSFLDCWSNTWKMGPDMCMERNYAAANVVGGKIYVAGGCKGCDKSNWMEVFDAKMHIWELVSCPMKDLCGCDICISAGMNGKVFTFGKGNAVGKCRGLAYLPKENTWTQALWEADIGSYKVIKNVLYYYHSREFKWKDIRKRIGGDLKGLEELPKIASDACVMLADYGGKMAVLWDKFVPLPSSGYKNKMIWCAVIALERRNGEEIRGTVEWFDTVLTVPKSCEFVSALAVTV